MTPADRLAPPEPCDVCAGTGTPLSGKPCICKGIGTRDAELRGFRERCYDLEQELERVRVVSPTDPPQKDELQEAYDGWRRTLEGVPQKNGQYAHLAICSGDRRQPPGTRGISCCCRPSGPRSGPTDPDLRAALERLVGACETVAWTKRHDGAPYWSFVPADEVRRARAALQDSRPAGESEIRLGDLASVNIRNGVAFSYCPECGTEQGPVASRVSPPEGP